MRKSALLLTSVALALLLASGVAWAATINCGADDVICYGTTGSDTIYGSAERDRISGAPQGSVDDRADVIYGNGGEDQIGAGGGADDVFGDGDGDVLYGGDGNDTLRGNDGGDTLQGGDGDDTMKGGPGADRDRNAPQTLGDDTFYGGPGGDSFSDDAGRNVISGQEGNDYVYGHGRLVGGRGDDEIVGYARNYETKDEGPRGILGGPGHDTVRSEGTTNDTVYVSDGERDVVGCGGGDDTVYFDKGIDKFRPESGCETRIPR